MNQFTHLEGVSHPTVAGLCWWMKDRHEIYRRRVSGAPPPWTADPTMRDWRFTNVFRELDAGTLALRDMISRQVALSPGLILFNVAWYRTLNRAIHAKDLGWVSDLAALSEYANRVHAKGEPLFTSAHVTGGLSGMAKIDSFQIMVRELFPRCDELAAAIKATNSIRKSFDLLIAADLPMIGRFTAYEIVTDLRWYDSVLDAHDVFTWANVGPGSGNALKLLGLPKTVESMIDILTFIQGSEHHYVGHEIARHVLGEAWPAFELREVEHSLCEYYKWCRAASGGSRPRSRFHSS